MALALDAAERRVLGVLLEKGFTTPEQYPLTLNGLVTGCNQKSCRDPHMHLDEEKVLDALDSLRAKGLASLTRTVGGRTDRYKHRVSDTLQIEGREAAVFCELLVRGPQTDGELRQRASRMVTIPGLPELAVTLDKLNDREEALVMRLGPPERRRGAKYAHTLYPENERPSEESTTSFDAHSNPPEEPRPASVAAHGSPVSSYGAISSGSSGSSGPMSSGSPHSLPTSSYATTSSPAKSGEVEELRQEISEIKARLEELEATFVRFFK